MSCIPLPPLPFPTLPSGFSISPPALPPVPYPDGVCCKIIAFNAVAPPLPLGALLVNSAFIVALTAGVKVVQTYVDALPLKCPKE